MYTASVQGIQQNLAMFNRYARDLQDIEKADVVEDMVGMMISEKGVYANVNAIRTAYQMDKQIIDMIA
ncbi:MAG: hypothetical protein GF404_11835 [candidate division Zixibacteria bacterium]|nr:hypothetical protein [candidate division Zixibacteria bacterium]